VAREDAGPGAAGRRLRGALGSPGNGPILILPALYMPRLGIAGFYQWAMPPWRRCERVQELARSLGVERTSMLVGLAPAQVIEIQRGGHWR
jgi:hypothetical protein